MINRKDIVIEYFRSSGPGGQRRNKKDTAVRITHLPTGIRVVASENRHRSRNLRTAFLRLGERLKERETKKIPRIPTRMPISVKRGRLDDKRYMSRKKSLRKKVDMSID